MSRRRRRRACYGRNLIRSLPLHRCCLKHRSNRGSASRLGTDRAAQYKSSPFIFKSTVARGVEASLSNLFLFAPQSKNVPPQKTPRCSSCQNSIEIQNRQQAILELMEAIVPYFVPWLQLEIAEPACLWVSITFPEVRIRKGTESGPVGDSSLIL